MQKDTTVSYLIYDAPEKLFLFIFIYPFIYIYIFKNHYYYL